jgi:hypothetical protein
MDVFAAVCLVVIAIAALAIGHSMRQIGRDLRRTRRLLEHALDRGDDIDDVRSSPLRGGTDNPPTRRSWFSANAA